MLEPTIWFLFFLAVASLVRPVPLQADCIDQARLVEAIGKAENSKSHPYGVMGHGCIPAKVKLCREICLNTIERRHKEWVLLNPKSPCDIKSFVTYTQKTYAPLGAKNDPTNLNSNWQKNTLFYYERLNA